MSWISFSRRLRPYRTKGPPEALVVLLHDLGASAKTLTAVAEQWSAAVPATAFVALDGIEQLELCARDLPQAMPAADADAAPTRIDRAAHRLAALLDHELRERQLDGARLVLVGFGYGGTLALHLLLRQGWNCAGILAIAAQLVRPLPRILRIDCKVRLIDCGADTELDHGLLRDKVALLNARGLDTRGVLLPGSALSDEAIRHGGAYLVELVATAQRGNHFHADRESSHA